MRGVAARLERDVGLVQAGARVLLQKRHNEVGPAGALAHELELERRLDDLELLDEPGQERELAAQHLGEGGAVRAVHRRIAVRVGSEALALEAELGEQVLEVVERVLLAGVLGIRRDRHVGQVHLGVLELQARDEDGVSAAWLVDEGDRALGGRQRRAREIGDRVGGEEHHGVAAARLEPLVHASLPRGELGGRRVADAVLGDRETVGRRIVRARRRGGAHVGRRGVDRCGHAYPQTSRSTRIALPPITLAMSSSE